MLLIRATERTPPLSAKAAQALARALDATLVEFYRHTGGWGAFVVSEQALHYVPLPEKADAVLKQMLRWVAKLNPKRCASLGPSRTQRHLNELHATFLAPLQPHLPEGARVILAPFGALHRVPLAAAQDKASGRYAADTYVLAFAPSLGALHVTWQQAQKAKTPPGPERLLSVAYPGAKGSEHYRPNVLPEAEAIEHDFKAAGVKVTALLAEQATPDAVVAKARGQTVVHLCCHGQFDPQYPEQSGLLLVGGWLTVRRIINELHLGGVHLATLGACLSGRPAVAAGEELTGLTQAALTAGAETVVVSLWSVADVSTRVLFEQFYKAVAAGKPAAELLWAAARWVRGQEGWEHPYYWAAFTVNGLPD